MYQPQEQKPKIHVVQNKLRGMGLGSQLKPQSQQIRPFIQTMNKKLMMYLHPHSTPQRILMGNHRMEHCCP
jgi:hypothetical protein